MGYEYKPSPKGQGKTSSNKKPTLKDMAGKLNNRKVMLAVAVLIVAVFALGSFRSFTGLVAQKEAEQNQLQGEIDLLADQRDKCSRELVSTLQDISSCKGSLDSVNAELTTAKTEASTAKSDLASAQLAVTQCQSDLSAMSLIIQQINGSLTECQGAKSLLEQKLNETQIAYDKLAISSAKAICCRPGIPSSSWSVSGDGIVCTGDKTVSC